MTWRDLRGDPQTPKESVGFLHRWLAMPLQRQDSWLRWMLIALAAIALATALVLTAYPHYWLYAEFGIYVVGALGFTGLMVLLLRAFSPAGVLWFLFTILVFNVWNLVVMVVSAWTGWWHDAQPGYRFVISALIGVHPPKEQRGASPEGSDAMGGFRFHMDAKSWPVTVPRIGW